MSKANPYQKYLGKEDVMQAEIVRVLSLKYPKLFWWHTVNEGERTSFEQYKFKELGGKSGVSDFVILEVTDFSLGLMMEIKWGKNACTSSQVDFLIESAKRGYTAAVVYDHAEEAIKLIDLHLNKGAGIPGDGILLIKNGETKVIPFDQAHQVLMKKSKAKDEKQKAKELFKAQAVKRFGDIRKVSSKLFQSLK